MEQTKHTRTGAISLYEDQLMRGFGSLRFVDFLEADFRSRYLRENFYKSRMVIGLSLVVVIVMAVLNFASGTNAEALPAMAKYGTLIMLPALLVTIVASYFENKAFYAACLAFCGLAIGIAGTIVDVQASAVGQGYYFAGQIGWILMIWTMFGLMFLPTAVLCASVSLIYIAVAIAAGLPAEEIFMESFMLLNVNMLGGYSCYKIEFGARQAYLDSHILSQRAERDGMTSLYNRRAFDEYMDRVWRQSRREDCQLTIMLIDIDHFKHYNDMYGHQAGDDALKAVARTIADSVQRPLDLAARYGGEEFALVLYGPANDYVQLMPEQLRASVEKLQIEHKGGASEDKVLTISIGVAVVYPDSNRSLAGAIQMADEALYQAKEAGRNQVVMNQTATTTIETGRFRARKRA
jgi:diguanylate cyclase (GGDEF)-like protein